MLTLLLLAAVSGHADDRQREVSYALTALNNGIEAISYSDACLHRSDLRTLEPLNDRIEEARRRAVVAFPALAETERAGNTDFTCTRASQPMRVSTRAIRRTITQLITDVEGALAPERADVP